MQKFAVSCLLAVSLLVSGGAFEPAHACAGLHHEDMAGTAHAAAHAMASESTEAEGCEMHLSGGALDHSPMSTQCCQSAACGAAFFYEPVSSLSVAAASVLLTIRPASFSSHDLWTGIPPYQPPRSLA